jgi:hypothetical protein
MNFFYVIAAICLFITCQPNKSTKESAFIEKILNDNVYQKVDAIILKNDTLEIFWVSRPKKLRLPLEKEISEEQLKLIFKDTKIGKSEIGNLTVQTLETPIGSKFIYSEKWGLIEAEVKEKSLTLLGSYIHLGMTQENFFLLFLKSYHACLADINNIILPSGYIDNKTEFIFTKNKLTEIRFINYPD